MFSPGPGDTLRIDGVDPHALARAYGTPLYVYSARAIRERIGALGTALQGLDAQACYAVKANPGRAVLALMAEAGLGADIVSAGELRRALDAGIAPARIVFSGVGKTAEEIAQALEAGIWRFNVESADELHCLQRVARGLDVEARASVRVNPDVDAGSHEKISTGRLGNKFGVGFDEARRWFALCASLSHVRLDGLHVHIGSQILDAAPLREAFGRVAALWRELAAQGHRIACIDVGGGLGVCYRAGHDRPLDVADYVGLVRHAFTGFAGRLVLEPGRWLVAGAGALLTRVVRIKDGGDRVFLVVDAAMNDLPRPSLYDAWHDILPLDAAPREQVAYDVVGPVCESADILARARALPRCHAGDLLAIAGTGAYASSMASSYNSRPLAAEVMIDEGRHALVRRRQTIEDLVAGEQLPVRWQVTA